MLFSLVTPLPIFYCCTCSRRIIVGGKGACRFCGSTVNTALNQVGYVCSDAACMERSSEVCEKTLACGHPCNGVMGEEDCLPCLHHGCAMDVAKLKQDADDMCMICYTEGLSCAPCIQVRVGRGVVMSGVWCLQLNKPNGLALSIGIALTNLVISHN